METLKIVCSPFVPEESIDELAASFSAKLNVSREVIPIERNRTFENFEVKELIDLVVTFASNNEFLQSVFKEVGVELIKESFKKAFNLLARNKRGAESSMEICLSYKDVKATFTLKGKYSEEDIQKCFDAFSDLIIKGQLLSDLSNPRFHKDSIHFDGIKYRYDSSLDLWVPYDYENNRQEILKQACDLGH